MLGAANMPDDLWGWSLSNALSLAQATLTAAGFALAIWQLVRAANVAVESRDLLGKLRVRLIGNDLLVLVPDLHALEDRFHEAVKVPDPAEAEQALVQYSRKAGEILGLLESDENLKGDPLVGLLKTAEIACGRAKSEIFEGSEKSLSQITATASKRIAEASHEASALRSRLQRKGD